ncbi:perlucin-like protein [Mytilus californianus]|uniref:perlucin-like protein n=1 Tax=Mytilus californianus TaxID=6549 RepID=UPI0022464BF0|nr:perlucin-like protein [Mytilus californianus]
MHKVLVVFLICTWKYALGFQIQHLPCLTDGSKKDLYDARKELTIVDRYFGETVETLQDELQKTLNIMKNQLVAMQTNVNKILKKVETDLTIMKKDVDEGQWTKYQDHCYHFSQDSAPWYKAERLCRDFGGYLVKIDNSSENEWLHSKRQKKSHGYWIGLTDLIEGEWRWSIDQSLATFKAWDSSAGSSGHSSNCVSFAGSVAKWFDTSCKSGYYYICERHFCY